MKPVTIGWRNAPAFAAVVLAGAWVVIAWSTWSGLGNGVRFGSPWHVFGSQAPLLKGPVQLAPFAAAMLLNAAATVIGYAWVVRPVWGGCTMSSPGWSLVAGFVPGTLILIAISRLTTLVFPNSVAPGLLWLLIAAATTLAGWRLWAARGPLAPRFGLNSALFLAALGAALLLSVHIDRAHVMGSTSQDFIRDIFLNGPYAVGAAGHFPLISQHYDEPSYLYPVVYGLLRPDASANATMTLIFWPTLAFGRVSLVALVYLALLGLALDRLSALVLTAFVWGASLALNPIASTLLFDALSPLVTTLHLSRILAAVTPLLFISAAVNMTGKPSPGGLAIAGLVGAGLSSMTINIALAFPFGLAVLALTAVSPSAARAPRVWRAACVAAVLALAGCSLTYALQGAPLAARVGTLVVASVAGGAVLAWALFAEWRRGKNTERLNWAPSRAMALVRELGWLGALQRLGPSVPHWLAMSLGYGLGLVFLGNVLFRAFKRLGPLRPWPDVALWERYLGTLATNGPTLMQQPFCSTGYQWGYRTISDHCGSLPLFVRTYGLSMVVLAMVFAWWAARPQRPRTASDRTLTMVFWALALCLIAQPITFAAYDFLYNPELKFAWERQLSVWLRSRLLEAWFYGGILLALALFLRNAGERPRRWAQAAMLAAVAAYLFNPLTVPAQVVANTAYIAEAIFGRQ